MDEVQLIQYVAIILAIFVAYTEIKRARRTTESKHEVGFPRTLMHEDLPRGKAKIEDVEPQGSGKFTLTLDDGYSKEVITINEVDVEIFSLYDMLVSDSPIIITKELKRKLSKREIDRLKAMPLVEEREKAQSKLMKALKYKTNSELKPEFHKALQSLREVGGSTKEPTVNRCRVCGTVLDDPGRVCCSRQCTIKYARAIQKKKREDEKRAKV